MEVFNIVMNGIKMVLALAVVVSLWEKESPWAFIFSYWIAVLVYQVVAFRVS